MLRIRLRRVGAKKKPSYRIVVADSRAPRDGSFVDQVGHYNPLTDPPTISMDEDKVVKWLGNGAQPSEPVEMMLRKMGIFEKLRGVTGVMKELIEYIAKSLASNPDEVRVTEESDDDGQVVLKLLVADEDKGKIIGKQGRVAQAMRVLLRVRAVKEDTRASLEIV